MKHATVRQQAIETGAALALWAATAIPAALTLLASGFPGTAACVGASILPLALLIRRQAAMCAREKVTLAGFHANSTQLALAEKLAGVGRVSLQYPGPQLRWSSEFCAIAGLEDDTPPSTNVLGWLLPLGLEQIETTLDAHRADREPFLVEFEIVHPVKGDRVLRAQAHNQFSLSGKRDQVFMVVRDVTEEYERMAEMEAAKIAAVEQAAEAMRLAETDVLTGLANRRAAMAAIDRALVAARGEGSGLALLIFDIDHFKQVNDEHGHLVGDRVLKRVADLAGRQARGNDCLARIGGEEFLWLILGADASTACDAAERLRWAIEAGTALAPMPAVTVSVGWARLEPGDSSLSLFSRADFALMEAKREGRNQVRAAAA